jgi:hypothetical protein
MAIPVPLWNDDLGAPPKSDPAIWLYPERELEAEVELSFHGAGFMTISEPAYNGRWRIHVDPSVPFSKYRQTYVSGATYPYLDYDGFRDGPFQRERGWCVEQAQLLRWQRELLSKLGFTDAEIDDSNYGYGRLLLERRYPERFFAVYPQEQRIVDKSVSLRVEPRPDTVYRLWMYFVPVRDRLELPSPDVKPVERKGFTVVELGFVSDLEIPDEADDDTRGRLQSSLPQGRMLTGVRQVPPRGLHRR